MRALLEFSKPDRALTPPLTRARTTSRGVLHKFDHARSKIGFRKSARTRGTRLLKRLQHTEKPPNAALRLTFSTTGQPHNTAGRRRRPKYDLAKNGQPAPSEASATQPDDVRQPLRVVDAGRDTAFLVKTTYCCSSRRRPRSRLAARGKLNQLLPTGDPPVAPPRRRRALARGTRYWKLARPATARRACRSARHPSQDASVGDGCVRC